MDIILARTFLMVAETGSFIDASAKMHVTQSTVSTRIKTLEELLGRPLFSRSKTGATLTSAGEHFQKHALALIRVWQHAQLEVGLSVQHRDHLSVGAPSPLWDGLLLSWVAWLRINIPDIAVSASAGSAVDITQRLVEGTLDLAVLYRPAQPPGLVIEHLFDEEFVLVVNAQGHRRNATDYIVIDWGVDFQLDHAAAFPDQVRAGLHFDIGSIALNYVLHHPASAYFPRRLVTTHIAEGRLRSPARARRFVYPVYMAYPEAHDVDAYAPILEGLRDSAIAAVG
jgi:LysR family transcriptional regulator, flagellar master operon regulator